MSLLAERIAAVDGGEVRAATGRRGGSLGFIETIGQSIANVPPTLTPALNITVVGGIAGTGSWLAYLIASIGMMFVMCIGMPPRPRRAIAIQTAGNRDRIKDRR